MILIFVPYILLSSAGSVSICEPAPVPPTMYSFSKRSFHSRTPDVCHATQMAVAWLMLPIQFICRGSKFAPFTP